MTIQTSSRLFALGIWIGFWILAFTATHIPIPKERIVTPDYADKVVHCGMYCLLVLLCGRFVLRTNQSLLPSGIWSIALVYALYGLFDEWSQAFVGRDTSFLDFLADLAGITIGAIVLNYVIDTSGTEKAPSSPQA